MIHKRAAGNLPAARFIGSIFPFAYFTASGYKSPAISSTASG